MNASELREKTSSALKDELNALLREQFNLNMQRGMGRNPNPHLFKKVRRQIARVQTIMKEKTEQ